MTLPEFKAWFDGFTEDMDGAPTEKQWVRIKARVGEITGHPISYPVYVDRYVRPFRQYWAGDSLLAGTGSGARQQTTSRSFQGEELKQGDAMTQAGRAEAKAVA